MPNSEPNSENINRLVNAAWNGIEAELARQNASPVDVVNATVAIAAGGIFFACSAACQASPEEIANNKLLVRAALQKLILINTTDDSTVM